MAYFRPIRQSLRLWGLTLALALLGGAASQARLPYEERIPANALGAVGISSTPIFWQKAADLPLAKAIDQYLGSPQLAQDLDYQAFILERQKLEQTLGYPATMNEFFTEVFGNALFYAVPTPGKKPAMVIVLGVQDQTKAAKLLKVVNEKNQATAAADKPTSGTANPTPDGFFFEQVKIGGIPVSHYRASRGEGDEAAEEGYYALAGERLVFSTDKGALSEALRKESSAHGPSSSRVTPLIPLLPWNEANLQGWMDGEALARLSGLGKMMSAVPGLSNRTGLVAFTFQLVPGGLVGKVASAEDPARKGTKLKARKLNGLSLMPPAPLLSLDYGIMDPDQSYQDIQMMLGMMGAVNPGGANADSPLGKFEQETGISVQQQLVPALGHEVLMSCNNIQLDMQAGGFVIDAVLGAEMRDVDKMKAVMGKLEKYLERMAAERQPAPSADPQGPVAAPAAPKFKNLPVGGLQIRSLDLGQPWLSPSYVMTDQYVLVAPNPESLRAALGRLAGKQPSIQSSPFFGELKSVAGTDRLYSYSMIDVAQVANRVATPFLAMLPLLGNQASAASQQQLTQIVTQVLPHLGTAVSVETGKGGVSVGYLWIKMQ